MTDDDTQTLARIGVQTVPAAKLAPARVLSVTRVTLPTFEVVYRDADGAFEDAQTIRNHNVFELPKDLEEPPGAEVVLELALADAPFSVTLLFRLLATQRGKATLEWWARRSTDARLLELWIDALDPLRQAARDGHADSAVSVEIAMAVQSAMEIYRRVLSSNPFEVLGIHWTASGQLVDEAARSIVAEIERRATLVDHHEQVTRYLRPAVERIEQAAASLASVEGRCATRAKMVPQKEASVARRQAEYLLQMAERAGNAESIEGARALLLELTW